MGTPLKSLSVILSPKVLSPLSSLSPRSLSVAHKNENVSLPKYLDNGTQRVNYVKRLDFSKFSPDPKPLFGAIQVKVSDHSNDDYATKRDFLMNTPNKQNVVKNGLTGNKNFNILGKGSFGKVVRGIYKEQIVAVKVVKSKRKVGEKNATNLHHDNIVRTIDIIENAKENYSLIVMEYFPNSKQLQSLLEDSEINLEERVISIASQICQGVEFCHKNQILHLDIKPQNVLVCGYGCKLCDFGNSVRLSEIDSFCHKGTVLYTAPELLQGRYPTEKCDVYSLGVLFWQLRSRTAPYCDIDNIETVVYKVVKCGWRPENEAPLDEYSKLYQLCWHTDPISRPCIASILKKLSQICC